MEADLRVRQELRGWQLHLPPLTQAWASEVLAALSLPSALASLPEERRQRPLAGQALLLQPCRSPSCPLPAQLSVTPFPSRSLMTPAFSCLTTSPRPSLSQKHFPSYVSPSSSFFRSPLKRQLPSASFQSAQTKPFPLLQALVVPVLSKSIVHGVIMSVYFCSYRMSISPLEGSARRATVACCACRVPSPGRGA